MEARDIGERDFTQRHQAPRENGKAVAPRIVRPKGMDSDAFDCRTAIREALHSFDID
jgi:hypothetical protein